MTKRRLLFALLSLLLATAVFAADEKKMTARSFEFNHKAAERAAAAIKGYMSPEGSLSIQPSTNRLVVTDYPENIRKITAAIEKFDVPARAFRVSVKLVVAGRGGEAKVPADLKEVAQKLSGVLRFNTFEKVGEIDTVGKEGAPLLTEIAPGYRADFTIGEYDAASDTIRIDDFKLSKVGDDSAVVPLLTTALNLKLDQTVVLGASRGPQSGKVLMLVLLATAD